MVCNFENIYGKEQRYCLLCNILYVLQHWNDIPASSVSQVCFQTQPMTFGPLCIYAKWSSHNICKVCGQANMRQHVTLCICSYSFPGSCSLMNSCCIFHSWGMALQMQMISRQRLWCRGGSAASFCRQALPLPRHLHLCRPLLHCA